MRSRLARATIATKKNLTPGDTPADWDRPGSLRMGSIEVTRLGMGPAEMQAIAGFMARVLIERESPETVGEDVIKFRQAYQTLYYNFDSACRRADQLKYCVGPATSRTAATANGRVALVT